MAESDAALSDNETQYFCTKSAKNTGYFCCNASVQEYIGINGKNPVQTLQLKIYPDTGYIRCTGMLQAVVRIMDRKESKFFSWLHSGWIKVEG